MFLQAFALFALHLTAAKAACPTNWTNLVHTTICVRIFAENKDFFDALRHCEALEPAYNSTLASIHNVFERAQIAYLRRQTVGHVSMWIGLFNHPVPSDFVWTDGTRIDFKVWEAKPVCCPVDPYAGFLNHDNDMWVATDKLEGLHPYICQLDLSSGTRPRPGPAAVESYVPAKPTKTCIRKETPSDLVFVMDQSSSVSESQFQRAMSACTNMVSKMNIGPGPQESRVGFVLFSDTAALVFNVATYKSKDDVLNAMAAIRNSGGSTSIIAGMQTAFDKAFDNMPSMKARIMLVITDGQDSAITAHNPAVVALHRQADRQGITVYALGIGGGTRAEELNIIARDKSRVLSVENYDSLSSVMERMWCP